MKALFWILLLGNAIFFAAMQWGGLLVANEQAVQAQPPLHEEKIGLLNAPQGRPSMSLPASIPVPTTPAPAPVEMHVPPTVKPDALCMEWGSFTGAELARATAALSKLQLGDKLSRHQVEYAIGYWVYIPPIKDKTALNQKVAQLKARGINDFFVVQDAGPWLHAISLGIFRTQEAAQNFLDELRRTKDVRSAQVGERASKLKATVFVMNGLDAKTGADLAEIQKDFHASELKNVSCALTR